APRAVHSPSGVSQRATGAGVSVLHLPHELADTPWWRAYLSLAAALAGAGETSAVPGAHATLARELVRAGHAALAAAVAHALVTGEPPLGRRAERELEEGERELLALDLVALSRAARRDLAEEGAAALGQELP